MLSSAFDSSSSNFGHLGLSKPDISRLVAGILSRVVRIPLRSLSVNPALVDDMQGNAKHCPFPIRPLNRTIRKGKCDRSPSVPIFCWKLLDFLLSGPLSLWRGPI